MELWDLYTKDRVLTGRTHIRGEMIPEGCFHLVVHVWLRNAKGEYLIAQRSADRLADPLMWECVGGSVLKGETSLAGALREVQEEVGIALEPSCGRLLFSEVREFFEGRRFCDLLDVWLFSYNGEAELSKATTAEVAQCRWMRPEEIRSLWDAGTFVNTLGYFFSKVEGERK